MILELAESRVWGTGSYEAKNIRIGSVAFVMESPIIRPCFAVEIRGSERPTSGKKPYFP